MNSLSAAVAAIIQLRHIITYYKSWILLLIDRDRQVVNMKWIRYVKRDASLNFLWRKIDTFGKHKTQWLTNDERKTLTCLTSPTLMTIEGWYVDHDENGLAGTYKRLSYSSQREWWMPVLRSVFVCVKP